MGQGVPKYGAFKIFVENVVVVPHGLKSIGQCALPDNRWQEADLRPTMPNATC
jgi:hypothetical protein